MFVSVTASAQNDTDTTAQPVITAMGISDGKKTEMMIGKEGGSFASSDGKLILFISEGTVSKKTTFSIQPITNLMPNGNGQAYRIEPSGIQFQKPVQLLFHYTEEESEDSMQLLLRIAMQDDEGQWFGLKKFTLDTLAKTISGNVHHFCSVCKFDVLKIIPDKARVKVKKKKTLFISGMQDFPKTTDGPDLTFLNKTAKKSTWSVNNMVQGNSKVGTLTAGITDRLKPTNTYFAPPIVPDQNPVTVSVKLEKVKYDGINYHDFTLKSKILIYDNAYEVTLIAGMKGSAGSVLGMSNYKDTGSFVVLVNGKDTKIIEKVNKNTRAELDYEGKCKVKTLKEGSGNVHIIGARSIKVIPPASAAANPVIQIEFIHAPTIFPLLEIKCPPRRKGDEWTTTTTPQGHLAMMPAFPQSLKFEAKEGEQTIEEMNTGGIYYKVTVKQIKEDQ